MDPKREYFNEDRLGGQGYLKGLARYPCHLVDTPSAMRSLEIGTRACTDTQACQKFSGFLAEFGAHTTDHGNCRRNSEMTRGRVWPPQPRLTCRSD
uniref:Uncharacterized protein n=1 Tax=Coccidioides posadasii RMSCC 3488 TaxID=454284 RepID=A0A0J6F8N9_COCPO|nr:hypothetical protein CPAG_01966 [Coccidioides posadasii RMSCC 3488]